MKRKGNVVGVLLLTCMLVLTGCSGGEKGNSKVEGKIKNNVLLKNKYLIKEKDGKFGLLDKEGKQVIDYKYDSLTFNPNTEQFYAWKDEKVGLINENDEEIIPIKYNDVVGQYATEDYMFTDFNKTYVIDAKGKIEKTYDYGLMYGQDENSYMVGKEISKGEHGQLLAKKYGLVDNNGSELLKCEYSHMSWISDYNEENDSYDIVAIYTEKDGKAGIFDLKGNVVIPMEYNELQILCKAGEPCGGSSTHYSITYNQATQSYLVNKDDKYGVIKKDGTTLIETKFERINSSRNGYVANVDEKTTYYDLKGKEIIKMDGQQYSPFAENGLAVMWNGDMMNKIIDKEGNVKEFEALKGKDITNIGSFDHNGNISVSYKTADGEETALMNGEGKFIIGPIQTDVDELDSLSALGNGGEDFNSGFSLPFSLGKSYGSTDYIYTKFKTIENYFKPVSIELYKNNGEKLGEYKGDSISPISDKFYQIDVSQDSSESENLYGLISREGKVVLEPVYTSITNYDDYIKAEKEGKCYLLNKDTGKIELEY